MISFRYTGAQLKCNTPLRYHLDKIPLKYNLDLTNSFLCSQKRCEKLQYTELSLIKKLI